MRGRGRPRQKTRPRILQCWLDRKLKSLAIRRVEPCLALDLCPGPKLDGVAVRQASVSRGIGQASLEMESCISHADKNRLGSANCRWQRQLLGVLLVPCGRHGN